MASVTQIRRDAENTLKLYRDGRPASVADDGTEIKAKPSRLDRAQEELDAAEAAVKRADTRVVEARVAFKKVTAKIDAAEKLLTATEALADLDESGDESDDADEIESDDESGDESEPETDENESTGPARVNGRFVKRETVEA